MADCLTDYCADPLGTHVVSDCPEDQILGGLPAVVLFQCAPIDPSDGTEVLEMIAAGTAWLWSGLLGGIPEASPVSIDAQESCGDARDVRIDRTMDVSDANISQNNITWFNAARKKQFARAIAYNCSSGQSLYIIPASTIRVRGTVTWANQNNDVAKFVGQIYWNNLDDPNLIETPGGVFTS